MKVTNIAAAGGECPLGPVPRYTVHTGMHVQVAPPNAGCMQMTARHSIHVLLQYACTLYTQVCLVVASKRPT
jgi:hypothetical protein